MITPRKTWKSWTSWIQLADLTREQKKREKKDIKIIIIIIIMVPLSFTPDKSTPSKKQKKEHSLWLPVWPWAESLLFLYPSLYQSGSSRGGGPWHKNVLYDPSILFTTFPPVFLIHSFPSLSLPCTLNRLITRTSVFIFCTLERFPRLNTTQPESHSWTFAYSLVSFWTSLCRVVWGGDENATILLFPSGFTWDNLRASWVCVQREEHLFCSSKRQL